MAINLTKGQRIEIELSKAEVSLGRDSNKGTRFDFDPDASAFMLDTNKKTPPRGFFCSSVAARDALSVQIISSSMCKKIMGKDFLRYELSNILISNNI
jgi:hypothetical protein